MQRTETIMIFLMSSALTLPLWGCSMAKLPPEVIISSGPIQQQQGSDSASLGKRFAHAEPQGQSAVNSAIELSKKYARLSEQATTLRQNNGELTTENRQLKEQLTSCQTQLQQTKKELDEANDLMLEMRIELNNWKTNIIGFRGEMREAEKAQLEALLKILKILGGEVKQELAQEEHTSPSPQEPSQAQPQSPNKEAI